MHDGPNVPSSRVEHEHEEEVPHDHISKGAAGSQPISQMSVLHGGSKLKGPTPEDVKVIKGGPGHTSHMSRLYCHTFSRRKSTA